MHMPASPALHRNDPDVVRRLLATPGRWAVVGDVTEILTSLCARLYGRRAAANRAARAVAAATEDPS